MVEQPSNKQVEQRKETSATARRRSPPAQRLPSPSTTPATCTVALELVCEALDGLRNHTHAGRTGCAQTSLRAQTKCSPQPMLLLFVTVVTVVQRSARGFRVFSGITRTGRWRSSWVTARPSLLLFSRPNVSYCCWGAPLLFCCYC